MTFDEKYFTIGRLDRLSYHDTCVHRLDARVERLVRAEHAFERHGADRVGPLMGKKVGIADHLGHLLEGVLGCFRAGRFHGRVPDMQVDHASVNDRRPGQRAELQRRRRVRMQIAEGEDLRNDDEEVEDAEEETAETVE